MPEQKQKKSLLHHRGRVYQVPIYMGKQFRSFFYMNDWKMLPMAAVIAALVSMVIRKYFFITMEGTLMSAFALTCVAIWNGCFNSIQVICRERPIIKREHRSGMHITSYVFSNMIYQAVLCLAQSAVTMYVCKAVGVKFPDEGFMTPWLIVDIGITVFLISYASDMLSLLVSSIAHTTTAAMTVMPFILIFQLVFSGSIFTLPAWAEKISAFTISHYGLTAIASQADYNNQPMKTGWTTLENLQDHHAKGTITLGQVIDFTRSDSGIVKKFRDHVLTVSSPEWYASLNGDSASAATPTDIVYATPTDLLAIGETEDLDLTTTPVTVTVGELLDLVGNFVEIDQYRDLSVDYDIRVGDILDAIGRDNVKNYVINATSQAMHKEAYERTYKNIARCWAALVLFAALFASLSVIALEFIDKDKR